MGRSAQSFLKDTRKDLAAQVVDRSLLPTLSSKSHKVILWRCSKGHVWDAPVFVRSSHEGCGCPVCSGKRCQAGVNDLATVRPDVAALLVDPEDGTMVTEFSKKRLKWRCPVCGNVWEAPVSRLTDQGSRCPKCGNKRKGQYRKVRKNGRIQKRTMTTDEFIERAREVHGDKYDYSQTVYRGSQQKVTIICPIHGSFEQRATSHLQGAGCKRCAAKANRSHGPQAKPKGKPKRIGAPAMTLDEFVNRAHEIHGDKYDYSQVEYVNQRTKVKIICPVHGLFEQRPSTHLRGSGCPRCAHEAMRGHAYRGPGHMTTEEFIERARAVHGDKYDYSKAVYVNQKTPATIICPKHGEFQQNPYLHYTGSGCPRCAAEEYVSSGQAHANGVAGNTPEARAKRKATCLERYGAEHFWLSDVGREKMQEIYDDEMWRSHLSEVNASDEVQAKTIETVRDRYGVDYTWQSDIVKKEIEKTCMERYGAPKAAASPIVQASIDRAHFERYGVRRASALPEVREKIRKTNLERYGVPYSSMNPKISAKIRKTLMSDECQARMRATSLKNWGVEYPMKNPEVFAKAVATKRANGTLFRSNEERELADIVKTLVGDVEVLENNHSVLGTKELDVVVPSLRIAVEFNGVYWHSEAQLPDHNVHAEKARACADAGYQLITVWEDDWRLRRDVVIKTLAHKLHAVDRLREVIDCDDADIEHVFARKLTCFETSSASIAPFLDANHIQGAVTCTRVFTLVDDDGRVRAALGVRSPRNCARMHRGDGVWEIQRYVTQGVVPGGFTRLLAHAERELSDEGLTSWVSFSDECVSSGGLYRLAGFRADKVQRPDYRYAGELTDWVRVPKERFQKKRFRDDPGLVWEDGLTEHELALRNGLYRVYDCGKVRWVKDVR